LILCKDCAKAGFFSAKLVAEWKNISQVHFVYHIHLNGEKFWQIARRK
jgi:hypothetical protein